MYQNAQGVQVRDFLEENEARLKDKHFLYVVGTNLEEDTYLRRHSTRGSKDGINVKIGMSQSGVTARLKSYTHMSSNFDPFFPQSGIRVLFLKQFPRRTRGETGVSIVARVETRLKQILREMDRSVMGRGSEVFRINPEELFQIIEDIGNADASYEPRRQSERFGKTLLWLITDSDTGKQTEGLSNEVAAALDSRLIKSRVTLTSRTFIMYNGMQQVCSFMTQVAGATQSRCQSVDPTLECRRKNPLYAYLVMCSFLLLVSSLSICKQSNDFNIINMQTPERRNSSSSCVKRFLVENLPVPPTLPLPSVHRNETIDVADRHWFTQYHAAAKKCGMHSVRANSLLRRSTWLRGGDHPDVSFIGSWPIPDKLLDFIDSTWAILSVGAANEISFDIGLAEIADVRIHIVDPTPMAINHFRSALNVLRKQSTFGERQVNGEQAADYFSNIENTFTHPENLFFIEEALSTNDAKTQRFYKLEGNADANETYYTLEPSVYSSEFIDVASTTLENLARRFGKKGDFDVVKIDIEGFEVEVLNAFVDSAQLKPKLLLVDHDGARLGRLDETITVMKRLQNYGYIICFNRQWDAIFARRDLAAMFGCGQTCSLGCGKDGEDSDPFSEKPWDALSYVRSVNSR